MISCVSIQINLSNVFYQFSRIKFLTKKPKEYYPHQFVDSKNSADPRPQVDRSADRYITAGRLKSLSLTTATVLISKYPTISQYRDTECHDISISSLGYDMNPKTVGYCTLIMKFNNTCKLYTMYITIQSGPR